MNQLVLNEVKDILNAGDNLIISLKELIEQDDQMSSLFRAEIEDHRRISSEYLRAHDNFDYDTYSNESDIANKVILQLELLRDWIEYCIEVNDESSISSAEVYIEIYQRYMRIGSALAAQRSYSKGE